MKNMTIAEAVKFLMTSKGHTEFHIDSGYFTFAYYLSTDDLSERTIKSIWGSVSRALNKSVLFKKKGVIKRAGWSGPKKYNHTVWELA
jgi:hypothetical protein